MTEAVTWCGALRMERRALCCSVMPFGDGLGSGLGFGAPLSLMGSEIEDYHP